MIQALYWRYAVWTVVSSSLLRLILPLLPFNLSPRDFLYSSKRTSFRCFSPYQQMCFIPWCVGRMWHRHFSLLLRQQMFTQSWYHNMTLYLNTACTSCFFYIYLFISEKVLTHQLTDSSTHIVHPQALQQAGQKMAMFHGHMVHSTVH